MYHCPVSSIACSGSDDRGEFGKTMELSDGGVSS
jgi:hypothetical protein